MFKYSWAYGGGQPELVEGDVFDARVPVASSLETVQKLDVDWVIERMLESYGYVTVTAVANIANVTERTVRRHISDLVDAGKLLGTGETRARKYVRVN